MSNLHWRNFLLFSCLVGVLLRLNIIVQPAESILSRYGSDDLFYYTEIAKNVVYGNGISFDGIHVTTGVQPLWMIVLLPFAILFENPENALKVVFVLASLFSLATAFMLPKLLGKLISPNGYQIGVLAGSIWMLHPKILQVCFEGTEAALAAFVWLCSIWVWQIAKKTNQHYLLGAVVGIGILGRIDHLVLGALLWFFPVQSIKRLTRKGLQMLPGIVFFLGGWLLTCWLTTGELAMDSGKIKRLHFLRSLALENSLSFIDVGNFSLVLEQVKGWLQNGFRFSIYLFQAESSISRTILVLLFVIIGIVGFKWMNKGKKPREILSVTTNTLMRLKPLFLAAPLVFGAYIVYLQYMRAWYLIPAFVCIVILCAALITDLVLRQSQSKKRDLIAWTGLFIFLATLHLEANLKPRKGLDPVFFSALEYISSQLPEGTTLGAFNSGMAGAWLSPKHTVVNLDGVVNHSAVNAIESSKLSGYMEHEEIEYLFDNEGSIEFFSTIGGGDFIQDFELVKRFPADKKHQYDLVLWKRKRP